MYPKYKPSEVDWLGTIPIHWEVRKLRYFASSVSTGTTPSSNESQYFFEPTETWYTPSDFDDSTLKLKESKRRLNQLAVAEGIVKLFPKNSVLVVGIGATLGRVGIAKGSFSCNQQINVIVPEEYLSADFLAYSLQVKSEIMKVISNATTLGIMNQDKTKLVELCAPDIEEQKQIADFLDFKTVQIDRLIEKKEALIEKLNEKRIALITQAVTKGLNLKVPMKPSSVDWLGEVPVHWNTKRLRFAIQSNPLKSEIDDLERDDLVSFVPMDAVGEYGGIRLDMEKPLDAVYDGYTYFRNNDVVIAKITPCFENGKGAIAEELTNGVAFGTTELHVMRPLEGYSSRWLFYLSICHAFREIGASEMYGAGGQKRVPEGFIKNFRIGIPDFDEQESIADFIDAEVKKMDEMLRVNNLTIERLTEYRTALITAAVTGKIDVRNIDLPTQKLANTEEMA